MQTAWPSLGSALKTPCLALSGPLLSSQGRSQVVEGGTADGKNEAGGLGGAAPHKLEGYMVIAGSFVAAF